MLVPVGGVSEVENEIKYTLVVCREFLSSKFRRKGVRVKHRKRPRQVASTGRWPVPPCWPILRNTVCECRCYVFVALLVVFLLPLYVLSGKFLSLLVCEKGIHVADGAPKRKCKRQEQLPLPVNSHHKHIQ